MPQVLYVGNLEPYTTSQLRCRSLERCGFGVNAIDIAQYTALSYMKRGGWGRRLELFALLGPGVNDLNRAVLNQYEKTKPQIVWIDKGMFIRPKTLARLKQRGCQCVVSFNTDDINSLRWRDRVCNRRLRSALPHYDVHITSNLHNVAELRASGYAHVFHCELTFDDEQYWDFCNDIPEEYSTIADIGFMGHWEPTTEELLVHLKQQGYKIRIYGVNWHRSKHWTLLRNDVVPHGVWGEDGCRIVRNLPINLGILSKWNRNHTAGRTFQFPAWGGFLIHEGNEVVASYFKENEEVVFFSSPRELAAKCGYYLAHPEQRKKIAAAGQRRCWNSGYSDIVRIRSLMSQLCSMTPLGGVSGNAGPRGLLTPQVRP